MSLNLEQATTLILERARKLVNQLVEQRGHEKPPFLPEEFARLQGIKQIVKADLEKVSAVLLRVHDGYVIKVNENHHPVRQNFSCAHEIGHTLLSELKLKPCIEDVEFRTFNQQPCAIALAKARERLCDAAAAELLMPDFVFRKYLSVFGVSVHSIERLASIFRVSKHSVAIRIAEVNAEPCIALLWKRKSNRSKALRLDSPKGKGHSMPVHTIVRYPSKLHEAYEYNNVVKCYKLFKLGNVKKRCLMESKGFGRNETRYVISLAFLSR